MAVSEWSTTRGERVLAVSGVFTCLATVLTALREYTRACIVKKIGADDYAVLVALAFSWGFFGLFVGEVAYGMGEHIAKLPQSIINMQMKIFWATIPIYNTALIVAKLSILLQYLRIFTTKSMRIACYCLIAFLCTYGTWTILSAWLNCIPVAKFWDETVQGHCLSKKGLWFSNSAIHIFTDIMMIIYPMPALKSLNLPKRQKIAVMGIFSLGGFVLITTILRLHSLLIISDSADPTYDNPGAACWSAIECNVAIICACLPGTRAFIQKTFPRFFSHRTYNYKYDTHLSRSFGKPGAPSHSRTTNTTNIKTTVNADQDEYQLEEGMGFSAAVNDAKVSGPVPSPGSGPGARDAAGSRTGTGKDKESRRIQVTTAIYAREDSASHLVDDSGDDDDDDGDDGESVRKLV